MENELHSFVSENETNPQIEAAKQGFVDDYEKYRTLRRELQKIDQADSENTREELSQIRAKLAQYIDNLYGFCCSQNADGLQSFEAELRNLISRIGHVSESEVEEYVLGAFMYPPDLQENGTPSPIEAIYSTLENYKTVAEFKNTCEPYVSGMILTGANSHGAFFSVTGKTPDALVNTGMEQKEADQFSDIDLFLTFKDSSLLIDCCRSLINNGLLPETEEARVKIAEGLFEKKEIDFFSVRLNRNGVEMSIHMVLDKTVEKMADFTEAKDTCDTDKGDISIGYLLDFRPNVPSKGGYLIKDIKGLDNQGIFIKPKLSPCYEKDKLFGYISQSPTGGFAKMGEGEKAKQTYFIGPFAFFLQIHPTVLLDKDAKLTSAIENMRARIKQVVGSNSMTYIPRQEKMAQYVLESVRKDFDGEKS